MEFRSETIRLLMEVGYVATGSGFLNLALTIFSGVQSAVPKSEMPAIGRAVSLMNAGQYDAAVTALETDALSRNPQSDLAKSFLGLALRFSGQRSRSEQVLGEVIRTSSDAQAAAMAQSILDSQ